MFGQYYLNLAKPTEDESFNSSHYESVSVAVRELVNDDIDNHSSMIHHEIIQQEIRDQLKLLKTGKAPGPSCE